MEGHASDGIAQQDADGLVRGGPDGRARVVVGQDLVELEAVLGVPIGAVLAHPHAVTEAGPLDDPDLGRGGRRQGERADERGEQESGPPEHCP